MSDTKKKNTAALDLTDGNPIRLLVLFSIPMFIGALFNLMYNMVDTVILGRFVSAEALASVGAAGSTFMLFNTFSGAVGNATSILVSQAWGAKEEDRIHHIVGQSLITGLAVALAVGFLAAHQMETLRTDERGAVWIRGVPGRNQMIYRSGAWLSQGIP